MGGEPLVVTIYWNEKNEGQKNKKKKIKHKEIEERKVKAIKKRLQPVANPRKVASFPQCISITIHA